MRECQPDHGARGRKHEKKGRTGAVTGGISHKRDRGRTKTITIQVGARIKGPIGAKKRARRF